MWTYPRVIAHRGGGCLAPENTLMALQCGLDWGFHAVEFDVMLTRDRVPVLMHDEILGRTVAGQGEIAAMLSNDVFRLEAGSWLAPGFTGARVPSYREVLEFCRIHAIWMNVEIKPTHGMAAETGQLVGQLTREFYAQGGMTQATQATQATEAIQATQRQLPLFSSFSEEALRAARLAAPEIPRAILFDHVPEDWQARLRAMGAVALHANHQHLTAALARDIKLAGYGLCCYTVNHVGRAQELQSWGVDAFCTDRLDLFGHDTYESLPR